MTDLPSWDSPPWSSVMPAIDPSEFIPAATAVVPSIAATPSATQVPDGGSEDSGKCELLGPFALVVQAALGALALLVLVYKRWKERPQRPVKVWAFDVSKQVFGSALLHLANLLASVFSAADEMPVAPADQPNPCSYYLLNLGIDTTLGIPILVLILRVLNHAALYTSLANPPESIESGYYGDPPNAVWWFKQSIIYFVGLLVMKACVILIIYMLPFIVKVGDWALRWTEGNTAVQITFVMLLFPVIMNAVQYYIIDMFIKKPMTENKDSANPADRFDTALADDGDRHHRGALLANVEGDDDDDDDDRDSMDSDETALTDVGSRRKRSVSDSDGSDERRQSSF